MPVYLCQPGAGHAEPWRHGIQVYATPCPIDSKTPVHAGGGGRDLVVANWTPNNNTGAENDDSSPETREGTATVTASTLAGGFAVRRVRHAEVVIVDDICIAYDRYWLRLRWPGHKGGFAGYIAMGIVSETHRMDPRPKGTCEGVGRWKNRNTQVDAVFVDYHVSHAKKCHFFFFTELALPGTSRDFDRSESLEDRGSQEETDLDDPTREEAHESGSMSASEPFESAQLLACLRTGLSFQSSPAMKLMAVYDDGITPTISLAPFPTEPVFCRICREGLHDDADEEQPSSAAEDTEGNTRDLSSRDFDDEDAMGEPVASEPTSIRVSDKGPETPHPAYNANSHALENPMLAPCECSGSMAFVHYLCVEQWRCRSRHPEAHNGLNCETCGSTYSLPPPSARPANVAAMEQEDWLDAMPPHVMQALRQPHIWWQIGAAIVRRRWLRPIAPVLMSPVVALYCRARRLLKKRGVARRRWACSLCRRRARWKCVRCLRSYYCSRQCQNVSWHIVHKHVCYKPVRFWWSTVVYGVATLALFPGILRDPLMYDLGLCLIPVSFIVTGILGGGVATLLKKAAGVDLRGRFLEAAVVLVTLWLTVVSWGLVKGFFGDSSACRGALGSFDVTEEQLSSSFNTLRSIRAVLLRPGEAYYLMWDRLPFMLGSWVSTAFCTNEETHGCFKHLPDANADFFLQEETGGGRCASDLVLVMWLYIAAVFTLSGSTVWKRHERQRRAVARRPARGEARLHED